MILSDKRIREFQEIAEKVHGREISWEEATKGAHDLLALARIAFNHSMSENVKQKLPSILQDKYRGAILGLAIGDALGAPVEFKMPGEFDIVTDFRDTPRFGLPAGYWTDDTAMALCLANSLIEKGFDPDDQVERYLRWLSDGYCSSTGKAIGVGQTVLRALSRFRPGESPYIAVTGRYADGNGTLMRIAPIPLYFRNNPEEAMESAILSSKITHGSQLCADACRYYSGLIIGALNGVSKQELLSPHYSPIDGYWERDPLADEVLKVAAGSFKEKEPPDIQGSGYVVKSLEAALWAFHTTNSFEDGVLRAVNLGDDADTTGAIYGQLAGAYYGMKGIADKWIERVAKREELMDISYKLLLAMKT